MSRSSALRLPSLTRSMALCACAAATVHAADGAAPAIPVEDRLQALELEIATLHQRVATTPRPLASDKDGFGFASPDGLYKLKLWGYLQAEGRFFLADDDLPLTNTFVLRRARIAVDGTVGPFDFRVMPDFGNGTTVLQDAYLTANIRPYVKVQAGRAKVPLGMEFLQNDTVTMFVERAFPTQLVPNRDTGLVVFGELAEGVVNYQVGVYNGGTDGANRDADSSDDKDGVARILTTPWKGGFAPLTGLTVGVAGSYGRDAGTAAASNLPSYKSSGQATIFAYATATPATLANTVIADGRHTRIAPQAYYAYGPFSTLLEFTQSRQHVTLGANHDDLAHRAWQIAAGYVLTGESASFKGLTPASPLAFDGSGWGAFEIAARLHRLDLDDNAFSGGYADATKSVSSATAFGLGVNWYLTRQVKLKLDYELTDYEGGGGGTLAAPKDRVSERLIETQLQLVF